jgi:glucose-1-phosphate adenylyltransferase
MHILPRAIEHDKVFAYPFDEYWRDVGTIQAFWEANMDIIRADSDISPQQWGIRSNPEADKRIADRCPARFGAGCKVSGSAVSAGCRIDGEVINSVLSPGVVVEAGASVRDSIIFSDCLVGRDAVVDLAILDKGVRVGNGAVVGSGEDRLLVNRLYPKHLYTGITLAGKGAAVGVESVIGRNCIVQPYVSVTERLKINSGETV